jgi:cysteine desulfurase
MQIYLDHNASTPVDARVAEAMLQCISGLPGNPSSTHAHGRAMRALVERARQQVADLVGVQPSQVYFTSGGTEANNLALHTVTRSTAAGSRVAISAVEHPSVLEPAAALQSRGWQIDKLAVDTMGRVRERTLAAQLRHDTALVSIMSANNETGVVQDIAALAKQVRAAGSVFHTDAVQAAGKIPLNFAASGAHLLSLSAHKIYGPMGVGALIVDKSLELMPMLGGGGQEKGVRAGTENVPGIVGFGVAAELALDGLAQRNVSQHKLRKRLETGLTRYAEVTVFAQQAERLPNTVQLAVAGMDGETLLMQLDRAGIAVSSGSACSSGARDPSHVLLAMGVDPQLARGAIRVSLGRDSTEQDIDRLLAALDAQIHWMHKSGQVAGW